MLLIASLQMSSFHANHAKRIRWKQRGILIYLYAAFPLSTVFNVGYVYLKED